MGSHLRGNLVLFAVTVVICCVIYPLVLYGIGQTLFRDKADGSLVIGKGPNGKEAVLGSRLIASPFGIDPEKGKGYFQPRPSAASFNATASGGSNLGASSPKLRGRVARQLGPIVLYNQKGPKKDDSVQKDIENWFKSYKPAQGEPPLVEAWASENGTLAGIWVKSDANKPGVIAWLKAHSEILREWQKKNADAPKPDLDDPTAVPFDDIAGDFFASFASSHPNHWPEPSEDKTFKPVQEGSDLQATFFDRWLRDHPKADLEKVQADMVMTSGSGLDPHITLDNALSVYQLNRVAQARAASPNDPTSVEKMRKDISELLAKRSFTPLGGLVGKPLVNVLEVNLELNELFPMKQ